MASERLRQLHAAGQSIWLDYIDRRMLRDGSLRRRIVEDSLTGMTSNPTIFEKALAEGADYDEQIAENSSLGGWELFELLETDDVRMACDAFAEVYEKSGGTDGFVSIEVSPGVANDAEQTVAEARRLWATVSRPNLMVKVPGTLEGATAVRTLIAEGVNVNVTLLFSVDAYDRIIEAYMAGLEQRLQDGESVRGVASVASFFVSRVDTEVDKQLGALVNSGALSPETAPMLSGKAAIANARLAYSLFLERFSGGRWKKLAEQGAQVQRPLWASTSTKNPNLRDVLYVEQLIGPHTVNTMPPATIEAFRDHGDAAVTLKSDVSAEREVVQTLESIGIPLSDVTSKLLREGLASFQRSFDGLISGLETKSQSLRDNLQHSQ